jgi:hypothetical protein
MTSLADIRDVVDAQIERTGTSDRYLRTTDSAAIDIISASLAAQMRPSIPDALVTWERPDDAVLAQSLGSALGGLPVIRADLDLGLWSIEGAWPSGRRRIAVVSTDWSGGAASALAALCAERGHLVCAVASVLADTTGRADQVAEDNDALLLCAERA